MICLVTLGLVIIGVSVYGIFFHTASPADSPVGQAAVSLDRGQGQVFTGLGQIRVSTTDPQPGMVILFVSFVFYPEDRAFSEELALRISDLREITREYIGSFSAAELQAQNEETIRAELLRRFNAILRLGQIETLFFNDFMILG